MIRYVSTRGGSPLSFADVLLAGTAPDGGLYIPDRWPSMDRTLLASLQGLGYADVAAQVIKPFTGDSIDPHAVAALAERAYASGGFDHTAVAPLIQIGPAAWILELFHGPTLSFKDYAMQFLGHLFDYMLEKRKERITIVGATSGDTGSAAIEACRRCRNVDIFILHPHERVSPVQRRQMTHVDTDNVHNIAVNGTFDDCQALVKAMFADEKMRKDLRLSAVNSINWARIMAQTVYYVFASVALGAPDRAVSFAVPTGNFGNVYACWGARQMGLPIHRIAIATNRNDILMRFYNTGEMRTDAVVPSLSPSMDIQVASNFERYLHELTGGDHKRLCALMDAFRSKGSFTLGEKEMQRVWQDFTAARCDDPQTLEIMAECHRETGIVIDPHTAAGLRAGMHAAERDPSVPMIVLATAHPAKFPDAVRKAIGQDPAVPPRLAAIMKKAEHFTVLPNDAAKVKAYIRQNAGGR